MRLKIIALVCLVIFAAFAMSFSLGVASNHSKTSVNFALSRSIVQAGDNGTLFEPNGPIDTPGAPGVC